MKKLILVLVLLLPMALIAQNPFKGFFEPKSGLDYPTRAEGDQSSLWFFRPMATMTAIQFTYNKELRIFESSTFSSAGLGIGYQHYVEHNGKLINNYGINTLLMLDSSQLEAGMSVAGTVNALQFVNAGAGYNLTIKRFFILVGAVYNF